MTARHMLAAVGALMSAAPVGAQSSKLQLLTADEIAAMPAIAGGPGTSGMGGIRTTLLTGDPSKAGAYTIALRVPANTRIAAHSHRDDRAATVVSGTWHFGYGAKASDRGSKALGRGSFYTEPAGVEHFARTGPSPVVLHISGIGPTDTRYVEASNNPTP